MGIRLAKEYMRKGEMVGINFGGASSQSIQSDDDPKLEPVTYDDIAECYVVAGKITLEMQIWLTNKDDMTYGELGAYTDNRDSAVEFYLKFC